MNEYQHAKKTVEKDGRTSSCPIWGVDFSTQYYRQASYSRETISSPRAGGLFELIDTHKAMYLDTLSLIDRIRLSSQIFRDNQQCILPSLNEAYVQRAQNAHGMTVQSRLAQLLYVYIHLGGPVSLGIETHSKSAYEGSLTDEEARTPIENGHHLLLLSATESQNLHELAWLEDAALKYEWIERYEFHIDDQYHRITPKGLEQYNLDITQTKQSTQAFVAMWFGDGMKEVYEHGIKPGVQDAGYEAYRVDEDPSFGNEITDQIFYQIDRSKFLIADFTHGEDGARGGVYFEAGYAKGKSIPIIWCIRADSVSKMHFDTNHYPHIFWKDAADLREKLKDKIRAYIGEGPLVSESDSS